MNLEEVFQQAWWSLRQLWDWLYYGVRDHPFLVLGVVVTLVILWRFLAPSPRWK